MERVLASMTHDLDNAQRFFQNTVSYRTVRTEYQKIVHLPTHATVGWEGLTRGPVGSPYERPMDLFSEAERLGLLLEVERFCRDKAIRGISLLPETHLFLNVSPRILTLPDFRHGVTLSLLEEVGIHPDQIVFEVTEHHVIQDYNVFRNLLHHYRQQGYKIAIDDVGAGHSGLVTLMQIKPDYVKIDMELIRGIHRNSTKQDIVRAILQIGQGFQATVIAEGIETPAELDCVQACGVDYGQGFLLGHPTPWRPPLPIDE